MKKNLFWQLLTLVILVVPSLYLASVWTGLPAQVPTHFGSDGQANGYSSRSSLWLLALALPMGTAVLLSVLPRLDPKRQLDGDSTNFQKLRLALVALLSGLACYIIQLSAHPGATLGHGFMMLLGVFFIFLGNYLTTVQPNYFVGIRTPWTLESPSVWARTHRLGGVLFCVSGLLLLALAFVVPTMWAHWLLVVFTVGTALFCYGYSYWAFRQERRLNKAV